MGGFIWASSGTSFKKDGALDTSGRTWYPAAKTLGMSD